MRHIDTKINVENSNLIYNMKEVDNLKTQIDYFFWNAASLKSSLKSSELCNK